MHGPARHATRDGTDVGSIANDEGAAWRGDGELELLHSTDAEPGIVRRGTKRFRYVHADGTPVDDRATLDRIARLAIPPAWTDVWICAMPNGHLQATGRDARGRKQSRYHTAFRAERENLKFSALAEFADALSRIRTCVAADLAERAPTRRRQIALVVHLLDVTAIRVGNESYARTNGTFGLSTLRTRQARVRGAEITFEFVGKSGKPHRATTYDRRIARLVHQCQDLPGQRLFTYLDADGLPHTIESTDVNRYLREAARHDVTAKTFRTWTATNQVASELAASDAAPTKAAFLQAIDRAAERLGNTRTVCRSSYVHPVIETTWFDGTLRERWQRGPRRPTVGMSAAERRTLHLLREFEPDHR